MTTARVHRDIDRASWLHVLEFNLLGYRRTFRSNVFSSFVQPTLFLAAMGLGLGGIVDKSGASASLGGVSYLTFLAPGLLAAAGISETRRAEEIDVAGWCRLARIVAARDSSTGEDS